MTPRFLGQVCPVTLTGAGVHSILVLAGLVFGLLRKIKLGGRDIPLRPTDGAHGLQQLHGLILHQIDG